MKISRILIMLMSTLFMMTACKKDEDLPKDCYDPPESTIQVTQLTPTEVTLPSKISVFFKLDDIDGDPIPNLTESAFSIYEQGLNDDCPRIVSAFEARRKVSEREQFFTYNTLLVLDLSGSVVDSFLPALKMAANEFINQIVPEDSTSSAKMGIWWFDGGVNIKQLVPITSSRSQLLAGINGITPAISNDNSTNLYGAVTQIIPIAESILTEESVISGASVVLFTDGRDRAARVLKQTAYTAVDQASEDISFFTIGLGGEINRDDLRKFGRDEFVNASDVQQLVKTFGDIAQLVNDEANSYYLFEYCSPIRNGDGNRLVLEIDATKTKKGVLETTFDATGFEGGCTL